MKFSNSTVAVGFVLRAHGIKGALRIRSSSPELGGVDELYLDEQRYRVVHATRDKDDWLVTVAGVADRNAAEALKGAAVRLDRDAITVAEGELLVADLVGCKVFEVSGSELGVVTGSFDSGAHEVLEVRTPSGREFMLPLVDAMVTAIDVAARRITCDPPPGLIDLDEPEGEGS